MSYLAKYSVGRMLMHLVAMIQDREVRWHLAGIARELQGAAA